MLTLIKRDINSNGRISTYMLACLPACIQRDRLAYLSILLKRVITLALLSLNTERNYLLGAPVYLAGSAQLFHFRASLSLSPLTPLSLHRLASLAVKSASRTSLPINVNNQLADSLQRVLRSESSFIRAITRNEPVFRLRKTSRAPESLCINDNARIHTKILVRV